MPHDHGHAHHGDYNRAFAIGVALNVVFVMVEAGYGFYAGSLALLADAGHNLSDVVSLLVAWGASLLASTRPTERRTYGFRRATILAALLSSVLLLVALGAIAWEALGRLQAPVAVSGPVVILVATIGVVINTATALLFLSGRKKDLNIRGAFQHMAADAVVSLGVVVAGIGMMTLGWLWLDPVVGLAIVVLILLASWGLFRDSFNLAVDAVPRDIDLAEVRRFLLGSPGVCDVHDLHVWGLSTTQVALTAHLVVSGFSVGDEFLPWLTRELSQRFGIGHATIQVESGNPDFPCERDADGCV